MRPPSRSGPSPSHTTATHLPQFSVANGALMGFTRALALEGKPHGIHANIVAPSAGKTVDLAAVAAVAPVAVLTGRLR